MSIFKDFHESCFTKPNGNCVYTENQSGRRRHILVRICMPKIIII